MLLVPLQSIEFWWHGLWLVSISWSSQINIIYLFHIVITAIFFKLVHILSLSWLQIPCYKCPQTPRTILVIWIAIWLSFLIIKDIILIRTIYYILNIEIQALIYYYVMWYIWYIVFLNQVNLQNYVLIKSFPAYKWWYVKFYHYINSV